MNVTGLLKEAWKAVEDAGLPEPIQQAAFLEAIRLLTRDRQSDSGSAGPAAVKGNHDRGFEQSEKAAGGLIQVDEAEMYSKVVKHTEADPARLERVVHLDDDGPRISLSGVKLGKTATDRTKAVARVLTVVRGFGLDENETPVDVIRAECARLKVLDSSNFMYALKNLDGYTLKGTGKNARLQVKNGGIEHFPAFLDSLFGE